MRPIKLTTTDIEAIRQLEWLSKRFDAISNHHDYEMARVALWAQQAFAADLLQRLGIAPPWDDSHFSYLSEDFKKSLDEVFRERVPGAKSLFDGPTALERYRSSDAKKRMELLTIEWFAVVAILNRIFPDVAPWAPGSTNATCCTPDDALNLDPRQRDLVISMYFGEFCRWLAWLIKTKSLPKVKEAVQQYRPRLTQPDFEKVRCLFNKHPEARLKDVIGLGFGSDKAQALNNWAREQGLNQKPANKRRQKKS